MRLHLAPGLPDQILVEGATEQRLQHRLETTPLPFSTTSTTAPVGAVTLHLWVLSERIRRMGHVPASRDSPARGRIRVVRGLCLADSAADRKNLLQEGDGGLVQMKNCGAIQVARSSVVAPIRNLRS
jgi:hypothetical protein